MKKLLLLLLISFAFSGCSLDEEETRNVIYEMIPVENVIVPEEFVLGREYEIIMTFRLPTECHEFYGTEYQLDENTAYFGILTAFTERSSQCTPMELEPKEASFKFTPTRNDFYIFKFWQGEDEDGNAVYITKEIPVVSESGDDV